MTDLIWCALLGMPFIWALTYFIGYRNGMVKANKWWTDELKQRTEELNRSWP